MKPFSLEEAQQGHAIQTRDGRRAQYLTYVPAIGAVVVMIDGTTWQAYRDGQIVKGQETAEDLFMVGKEKKVWANLYRAPNSPTGIKVGALFDTEDEALEYASLGSPVATVPIEYVA
jgi:hypothetical protein